MIEWIDVTIEKPTGDCIAYVMNCRGNNEAFVVTYHKRCDVWKLYDLRSSYPPCLEVTHWVPLPYPFIQD